jgi:hypothetical protein
MTRQDAARLLDIAWIWELLYDVRPNGPQSFTATYVGTPQAVLTADTPDGLHAAIHEHYARLSRDKS